VSRPSGVQRLDEGAIKLMKKSAERWNNTDGCIAGAFHFSAEPVMSGKEDRR
jgi:hypothetical protein